MIIPFLRCNNIPCIQRNIYRNEIRRNIACAFVLFNKSSDTYTSPTSSKTKSRSHKPKTLQVLLYESKAKEAEKRIVVHSEQKEKINDPDSQPTEKNKALDIVNTGPKVPNNWRKLNLPEWKRQRFALLEKFSGKSWSPKKKLSREEMNSVKILKDKLPDLTNTDLSQHFKISPEAIRRILKSKWIPTEAEEDNIHERWKSRGTKVKQILKTRKSVVLKAPKVIINSGKEYSKVRYFKDGEKSDDINNTRTSNKDKSDRKSLRRMKF